MIVTSKGRNIVIVFFNISNIFIASMIVTSGGEILVLLLSFELCICQHLIFVCLFVCFLLAYQAPTFLQSPGEE